MPGFSCRLLIPEGPELKHQGVPGAQGLYYSAKARQEHGARVIRSLHAPLTPEGPAKHWAQHRRVLVF